MAPVAVYQVRSTYLFYDKLSYHHYIPLKRVELKARVTGYITGYIIFADGHVKIKGRN
jgi:hypothetical protein